MKYFPLVWAALRRKPARTIATLLSVTIAFSIFGLMTGFNATMTALEAQVRADRVYAGPRFGGTVPIALKSRILSLPGAKAASVMSIVQGYVQDPKNHITIFMVDADAQHVFSDWTIAPRLWNAVAQNRSGVVINRSQADQRHLKAGDTLSIISPENNRADGIQVWTFKILDIGPDITQAPGGYIFGNYDYYDKALVPADQGQVNEIDFLMTDASQAPAAAQQIDRIFANSSTPTQSQTEKAAYALSNNFGGLDVNTLTRDIALAGLGMILFLTANVIAQSVRERTGEFAALKTMGFSDVLLTGLVVLEAALICLAGAGLGTALASWLASEFRVLLPPGFGLPLPSMTMGVLLSAALSALVLAVLSAALPALRVLRMDIATALARRA